MIQWMLLLVVLALIFSLLSRTAMRSDFVGIASLWIRWTGWLWVIIFGTMFINEVLRSAGAPNISVFQSGAWQPLGPMALGVILLIVWHRRQTKPN